MTLVSLLPMFMHVQTGSADQDHARWAAQACAPAWAKLFGANHCREVKAASPATHTLLRDQELSENGYYMQSADHGIWFVRDAKGRAGGSFEGVDALEFMNEKTGFEDVFTLRQLNTAALGFVQACLREGVRPVVHNAAFANPKPELMHLLAPSVQAALDAGGYYGLHCYGPAALFDRREWYVECYSEQLHQLALAGVRVPYGRVLITEFGHDTVSDPNYHGASGPWRHLGLPVQQLEHEYDQYAARLTELGIAGAFMYNCYGYSGDDFEIWPALRDWYNRELAIAVGAAQQLPPIGAPPVPPPTNERLVWPGPGYSAAWLRRSRDWSDHLVTAARGTRLTIEAEDAGWLKVSCWIPKSLTKLP